MKPALILQNLSAEGPAYLARWLHERGLPFEVFDNEAGQIFPDRIEPYAALAILGGEMSANDPLPSLRRAGRPVSAGPCLPGADDRSLPGRPVDGVCPGCAHRRLAGATARSRIWLVSSPGGQGELSHRMAFISDHGIGLAASQQNFVIRKNDVA